MAVQLRGVDAPAGANALSRTCTIPVNVQVGDQLLLMWVDAGTDVNGDTPPAGWTKLGDTDATGASLSGTFVYSRTAQAGDAGSTITRTADTTRRHGLAVAAYYDDAGATLSVESSVFAASLTAPALSTVAPNCVVVGGASVRGGGADPFTPPAGYVERLEQSTDTASGGKTWTIVDKLAPLPAGTSVGGITFTNGDPTLPGCWLAVLKPSSDPGEFFEFV